MCMILKKTDVSSALSVTKDVRKLELVYREWKTFSAENSLDTFSGMADGDYWNSLINSGKDGKKTGVYSQQCIVWTDRAGRQYRSALVIIGGDDYELYSCPADDTEKISKEKLFWYRRILMRYRRKLRRKRIRSIQDCRNLLIRETMKL